jgi:hypothetical protein
MNPIWYANIAYGLFFAGTALVALFEVDAATAVYWALGVLLGNVLVVGHYARVERALGVAGLVGRERA